MPNSIVIRFMFYVSRAREGLAESDLRRILDRSRRHNRILDVTGCLLFSGGYFAQVVEGRSENVEKAFARIALDERHTDIVVLENVDVVKRHYPDWSMGLILDSAVVDLLETAVTQKSLPREKIDLLLARMQPDAVVGGF